MLEICKSDDQKTSHFFCFVYTEKYTVFMSAINRVQYHPPPPSLFLRAQEYFNN